MPDDMIKQARMGNLVKFERAFKAAITERIPAVIKRERSRVANIMFNRDKDN